MYNCSCCKHHRELFRISHFSHSLFRIIQICHIDKYLHLHLNTGQKLWKACICILREGPHLSTEAKVLNINIMLSVLLIRSETNHISVHAEIQLSDVFYLYFTISKLTHFTNALFNCWPSGDQSRRSRDRDLSLPTGTTNILVTSFVNHLS